MRKSRRRCCIVIVLFACLQGCAGDLSLMVADLERYETEIELADTPFFAQVTDQCGPSALAAILLDSGVTVEPEALKERIYIPGREGSLQIELLAAARSFERIPYLIEPDVTALLDELQDGRPVLVLQNLGATLVPTWHYAVVVGYLPDKKQFVLRSGDQHRQVVRASRFIRSWRRAEYWGIVALTPGEMPRAPEADAYIRAVSAFETHGDYASAIAGYSAASDRWPDNAMVWLGLGNSFYGQGDLESAEIAYKKLLVIDPGDAVALNNLSHVQADRGCYKEASATLNAALSMSAPDSAVYGMIEESLRQLHSREPSISCL